MTRNPNITREDCRYGAPMGRPERPNEYTLPKAPDGSPQWPERVAAHKLQLARVRINSGGYDAGGAYWGTGMPLWNAWNGEICLYLRARNRELAKEAIRETYPAARFYR